MAIRKSEYRSIIRLDHELNQIQDLDLLLERILLEARRVVHADAGSIYVKEWIREQDRNVEKLVIKYAHNDTLQKNLPPGNKLIYSVFSLNIDKQTISGYCGATQKLVNVPDVYHIPPSAPYSFNTSYDRIAGYKTVSTLAIPLKTAEGRLMGVIQMINAKDKEGNIIPFSKDDEFLISHFAVNATVVLQRAYMTRAMILRVIKMSELRDPKETGPHVNRVAGYAVEIYDKWAAHQHISETERERFRDTLRIAAMLHDVGKVAISDIILKKPAAFVQEEYLIMQHHTIYGATLFDDPQSDLDIIARDIALTHHENWDGTGYPGWVDPITEKPIKTDTDGKPLGRRGEEIPLPGRIVAIADVYDALCSRRIYKEPWPEERVLEEIRRLSGSKFEPFLVECFFESLHNIKQIQALFPE
jgi:HD-GYP domain-containing protein (c-di-GMP phosphodiesterase class II)